MFYFKNEPCRKMDDTSNVKLKIKCNEINQFEQNNILLNKSDTFQNNDTLFNLEKNIINTQTNQLTEIKADEFIISTNNSNEPKNIICSPEERIFECKRVPRHCDLHSPSKESDDAVCDDSRLTANTNIDKATANKASDFKINRKFEGNSEIVTRFDLCDRVTNCGGIEAQENINS